MEGFESRGCSSVNSWFNIEQAPSALSGLRSPVASSTSHQSASLLFRPGIFASQFSRWDCTCSDPKVCVLVCYFMSLGASLTYSGLMSAWYCPEYGDPSLIWSWNPTQYPRLDRIQVVFGVGLFCLWQRQGCDEGETSGNLLVLWKQQGLIGWESEPLL